MQWVNIKFIRSVKMSMKGIRKVFVFAGLMLVVCGCGKPNLIGSEAAVYSRGTLYAMADQDLNSVYAATVKALEQLEIEVIETAKDAFYAKVMGKVADGKTVTIRIEPVNDKTTNLSDNASKFITGNEERALAIYEKIKKNL